ncbi:two-component system, chemotaxis family, response regulator CheY [Pseudovibrio ascidiaceicola]|uniref:Two-component system, chemotaxis family, response regulator CheY n=1 Tax=Pseudovibrio ascidiaceicola TaxID=285279 RepID=A0A1I4E396_9HYPH|nr:response regulator [Pseudovibrio ascidiaceicola]SFL00235.1 two-component system, chemotaxis family, response regulator CheY [Pseudovibrio ascidiaceicola]
MHHTSFGKDISQLDVVLVEQSKPTQAILRGILGTLKLGRVRVYDSPKDALPMLISDPPDLVLSGWEMKPVSGFQLLKLMRSGRIPELINVPLVFITAYGTRALVTRALEAGAHHLLVTPISSSVLKKSLESICKDRRQFIRNNDGGFIIDGTAKRLEQNQAKFAALNKAREYQKDENAPSPESEMTPRPRRSAKRDENEPLSLKDLEVGNVSPADKFSQNPYLSRRTKK